MVIWRASRSLPRTFLLPLSTLALGAVLLSAPCGAFAGPPAYRLTDLGFLAAGSPHSGIGEAINNAGQIVGTSNYDSSADSHAVYSADGSSLGDLGTLIGNDAQNSYSSLGLGINLSGQATGWSNYDTNFDHHAFRSSSISGAPTLTDLGSLPGGANSQGNSINSSGSVAGYSDKTGNVTHAFRSTDSTVTTPVLTDLGALGGSGKFSKGFGINSSGQVTGYSANSANATHAFRTTAAGTIDVASDLGLLPGGASSEGLAINDSGQVVGFGTVAGARTHAFRSSPNAAALLALTDLGTLGGTYSEGDGIDSFGDVVGYSRNSGGSNRAFLYTDSLGQMTDLNTLISGTHSQWILSHAQGINDFGQIVGTMTNTGTGATDIFLLDAITPEPGAPALLVSVCLAGAGLGLRRKRALRGEPKA